MKCVVPLHYALTQGGRPYHVYWVGSILRKLGSGSCSLVCRPSLSSHREALEEDWFGVVDCHVVLGWVAGWAQEVCYEVA